MAIRHAAPSSSHYDDHSDSLRRNVALTARTESSDEDHRLLLNSPTAAASSTILSHDNITGPSAGNQQPPLGPSHLEMMDLEAAVEKKLHDEDDFLKAFRSEAQIPVMSLRRVRGMLALYTGQKLCCLIGPHWGMMLFTYSLMSIIPLYVAINVKKDTPVWQTVTLLSLMVFTLYFYSMTACRDPGVIRYRPGAERMRWAYCGMCEMFRPPEYDHHCPWTGKCIGKKNIGSFYSWLVCLVGLMCITVYLSTVGTLANPEIQTLQQQSPSIAEQTQIILQRTAQIINGHLSSEVTDAAVSVGP